MGCGCYPNAGRDAVHALAALTGLCSFPFLLLPNTNTQPQPSICTRRPASVDPGGDQQSRTRTAQTDQDGPAGFVSGRPRDIANANLVPSLIAILDQLRSPEVHQSAVQ